MEACTLALYQKNIFRVTGLPVDATSKEVSRQAQKLQMLEEMSGGSAGPQPAFPLAVPPTTDEIRAALSRMKEPEHRIVDEFFWYWPEEFGASKSDPAIQAMISGDAEGAVQLWKQREVEGSHVAMHNLAIMYHMTAVDWVNHDNLYEIDEHLVEKVKSYWEKSFERWKTLVDADNLWEMIKERVRSIDDEALKIGFVRRMRQQLPAALARVTAETALRFAEQGRMDLARFHVNFIMNTHRGLDDLDSISGIVISPTRRLVEQHLESFGTQAEASPKRGVELSVELLEICRPMMEIFDVFYGKEKYQRNDLFDKVAETVLGMVISHQKATGDNHTFVDLLRKILDFSTSKHIRERITKNILIVTKNLGLDQPDQFNYESDLENAIKFLKESTQSPSEILECFLELRKSINFDLMRTTFNLMFSHRIYDNKYINLISELAMNLNTLSVKSREVFNDYKTAEKLTDIAIALLINNDIPTDALASNIEIIKKYNKVKKCCYCNLEHGTQRRALTLKLVKPDKIQPDYVPMGRSGTFRRDGNYIPSRQGETRDSAFDLKKKSIFVPRCNKCYSKQYHVKIIRYIMFFLPSAFLGILFVRQIIPLSNPIFSTTLAIVSIAALSLVRKYFIGFLAVLIVMVCVSLAVFIISWNAYCSNYLFSIPSIIFEMNSVITQIGTVLLGALFVVLLARKILIKSNHELMAVEFSFVKAYRTDGWVVAEIC